MKGNDIGHIGESRARHVRPSVFDSHELLAALENASLNASRGVRSGQSAHMLSARPEIEVSGIAARHSRVTSSTTLGTQKRHLHVGWSACLHFGQVRLESGAQSRSVKITLNQCLR